MRPKASSRVRKCRCRELDCALHSPLIQLQLSHNGGKKTLPKAGSPTMGTASPPQISQQREEIPLPKTYLSPMGAADFPESSRSERKCRCLELGYQPLPLRRPLSQPPLCPANSRRLLHCRLPHRVPPLLTLLAALSCCKQQIFPPRRLASFAATIRGLPRTSSSAPMTLYQPL